MQKSLLSTSHYFAELDAVCHAEVCDGGDHRRSELLWQRCRGAAGSVKPVKPVKPKAEGRHDGHDTARHTATVAGCGMCSMGCEGSIWFNYVQLLSNPKIHGRSKEAVSVRLHLDLRGCITQPESLAILDWKADLTHGPESGTAWHSCL